MGKWQGFVSVLAVMSAFGGGVQEAHAIPRDRILLESEPGPHDRAEDLVDTMRWTTLAGIEKAKATSAELEEQPWSDTYWPLSSGVIAQRYADPDFPASADWRVNAEYLRQSLGEPPSDRMSPAEKYDLLVGDRAFPLSKKMISQGQEYYERFGHVERWMGICHGWAPASYMMDRPLHSVTVKNREGTDIVFLPADIRALASLLWANASAPTRFIGGRCGTRDPESDSTGRPRDEECVDTNPATFHLAVVNQIAASRRSFVMDASYDYEVWNQPVVGYSYEVYNVLTQATAENVAAAKVALKDYPNDPRARFRSPRAKYVVGVRMRVDYMSENFPRAEALAGLRDDRRNTMRYFYDLELDERGVVVGGEWESRNHPDFLWTPTRDAIPLTPGDMALDSAGDRAGWKEAGFPEKWSRAARDSSDEGMPLARVVYELVARSREPQGG
jgi:hypothetical protein